MNISLKIKTRLEDPLKTFKVYQIMIAIVCITIPAILRIYDKDQVYPKKVKLIAMDTIKDFAGLSPVDSIKNIEVDRLGCRLSISDYVYSSNSYLFGMLLCIAAMLFIFNGAVYFKSQDKLKLNRKGKWYNIILGLSLLGVICTPHRDHIWKYFHYSFAIVFFFGNALVIGLFHNKEDKIKSIVMAILTVIFLILSIVAKQLTLFWAEWASLTVIGIHVILESRLVNYKTGKKTE